MKLSKVITLVLSPIAKGVPVIDSFLSAIDFIIYMDGINSSCSHIHDGDFDRELMPAVMSCEGEIKFNILMVISGRNIIMVSSHRCYSLSKCILFIIHYRIDSWAN
jgi:hypothetical protein